MVILGILFVLLLKTYNWIWTMVFRVQQEKEVAQEILQISQIMQNFSDRNTIDYPKYLVQWSHWLVDSKWITDTLYLSWQDGHLRFFSSGSNCIEPVDEFTGGVSTCSLYMITSLGKTIELINSKKIAISKVIFKIVPFASQEQYLDPNDTLCEEWNYLHCINTPWFRILFKVYSANYWQQRATHVAVPFQQFF